MITLPTHARRHWVSAFAKAYTLLLVASGAVLGSGIWWLASLGPVPVGTAIGAAGGLALGVVMFASPGNRRRAYDVWARLSRRVSGALAGYVTRLLFGVIAVAGAGGSRFELQRPPGADTNWKPKTRVPASAYLSQHGTPDETTGWVRSYASWGFKEGGLWVLFILPLVALLGWVQTQEKGSFGGNVYTLY